MNDYERAKLGKKIAESSYEDLKKRVEPYLVATEGLNEDEIERVNKAMQLESRKIALDRDESKNAMDVSKDSQTANKSKSVDKWSSFYSSLSIPRQKRVSNELEKIESGQFPDKVEFAKAKLIYCLTLKITIKTKIFRCSCSCLLFLIN